MTRLKFIPLCALLISVTLPFAGCNANRVGDENGDGGTGNGDGGGGNGDGGGSEYCSGKGPPIRVGDSNGAVGRCSGQVAAAAFRYGLCICQGLSAPAAVTVDAFDSSRPGPLTLGSGGSVGMNMNLNGSARVSIGGNLIVGGSAVLPELVVGVDTHLGSGINTTQSADLRRDAQINGDLVCNGPAPSLKVARTLTYPTGRTLTANSPMVASTMRNAVPVPTPCDCAQNAIFNVASYVQERQASNDNMMIGLDPARLTNFSGDQTIDFNCGRFYIDRIGGAGKLTFNITGRTALFVNGDINLQNTWTVNLGASGELDLFVNGGLTSSGPLNFGNRDAPARVRVYMGGSRNINLSAGSVFGGNIYAPESALVPSGAFEVFGAVFVRDFNPSGPVLIHHDIAILNASDDCAPSGGGGGTTTSCSTCNDCGGQACKGGSCGACSAPSDCCAPLFCRAGKCVYEAG